MNNLIQMQQNENGEILVSGRDLHDFLEVRSKYNDWFERMIAYGFVENQDYLAITQKKVTAQGNTTNYVDHHMKIDMAKEISMIQRSEKGKQARRYFLDIEKKWNSPEMIMKRALEFADARMKQLEVEIKDMQPKAMFADSVSASDTDILVNDLAKLLKQNGIEIGGTRLFAWLRESGYLIRRKGTDYNMPTQRSMELELFRIKETTINRSNGQISISKTPKVTGKGQVYFINKFLSEKNKVRIEG